MTVHVSMVVRNEVDRHLAASLRCARDIVEHSGGHLIVTDDASTDATLSYLQAAGGMIQTSDEPLFWRHEGQARQRHQKWVDLHCSPGDWILSLDADETVNAPELVGAIAQQAQQAGRISVGLPLYEFWSRDQYRTDGYWFGTKATRLYAWRTGGEFPDVAMGSGSEPTYVRSGTPYQQDQLHLLHWGYLREKDRIAKHARYTSREGGHGHNSAHVNSIITSPSLQTYNR